MYQVVRNDGEIMANTPFIFAVSYIHDNSPYVVLFADYTKAESYRERIDTVFSKVTLSVEDIFVEG
jgi:hypothetical protein